MRGIRLTSLNVSHFRGINDSVEFDFSSPLTVVFAPNGTGKTTMCEAAEWLLTGQVERLKEGNSFDASVLNPKFGNGDHAPSTAANLYIDGEQQYVRRAAEGTQSSAAFGANEESAIAHRPHDLFALLAPAAAGDEAHPLTAINLRQRWLKGTRFLSSEALAALVDTDEETIERRTQVFADLLGIRHLLDAERQCEKYVTQLSSRLRGVTQKVASRSAEASELELALGIEERTGSAHSISARSEANAAAKLFAPEDIQPSSEQDNFDDQLAALTALHRRHKHSFDTRSDAAKRVEAQWNIRASLEGAVADGIKVEAQLTQSLAEIERDGRQSASDVADFNSRREALNLSARELADAQDRLSHLSAMLVATLLDGGFVEDLSATLIGLSDKYPENLWSASARQQRRQELMGLGRLGDEAKRLEELEDELSAARSEASTEEDVEILRQIAAKADSYANAAVKLLDAVASPVARLQAAARELLGHDHGVDTGKCPLCSHDWEDAENLRSAINDTLSAAPEFIVAARSGVAAAEDSAKAARSQLNAVLQEQKYLDLLEKEHADLQLANTARLLELERLGVSEGVTTEAFKSLHARLDVADSLAELLSARDDVSPTVFGAGFHILSAESKASELLPQLEATFNARNRVIQLELADLAKSIESAIKKRDELRGNFVASQQSLKECRQALEQKSSELAALRVAWEQASLGSEWSDAQLASLMSQLAAENHRLAVIEGHIQAARAAWAGESRRTRLQVLRQAIQPLLDAAEEMNGRLDAAKRARCIL